MSFALTGAIKMKSSDQSLRLFSWETQDTFTRTFRRRWRVNW